METARLVLTWIDTARNSSRSLATIHAEVSRKPRKPSGGFWDFDRTTRRLEAAFLSTVRDILGVVEGFATCAASVLPVAFVAAPAWTIVRKRIRRAERPV